jgi:hypothetical protein
MGRKKRLINRRINRVDEGGGEGLRRLKPHVAHQMGRTQSRHLNLRRRQTLTLAGPGFLSYLRAFRGSSRHPPNSLIPGKLVSHEKSTAQFIVPPILTKSCMNKQRDCTHNQ